VPLDNERRWYHYHHLFAAGNGEHAARPIARHGLGVSVGGRVQTMLG
jgi:hypothetical protein